MLTERLQVQILPEETNRYNIFNKQKKFFIVVCCFYFSFLIGNLFGSFLNFLRNTSLWDGTILFIIIILFEISNFLISIKIINQFFKKIMKSIQFGIFLGFFLDAFKVGS
nr:hypothetical chloroplast RF20 [Rhipidosiphon lewmanomontiae]